MVKPAAPEIPPRLQRRLPGRGCQPLPGVDGNPNNAGPLSVRNLQQGFQAALADVITGT